MEQRHYGFNQNAIAVSRKTGFQPFASDIHRSDIFQPCSEIMITCVVSDFRQYLEPGSRVYVLGAKVVDIRDKGVYSTRSGE